MEPKDIPAADILPQVAPFVMVGKLVHYGQDTISTELEVTGENIFAAGGRLSPYGIIENVAQSCAARIGYYYRYILRMDIRIGYIGAIQDFKIFDTPEVGETIRTDIKVLEEIFNITMVEAEVWTEDRMIAGGTMKIALVQGR